LAIISCVLISATDIKFLNVMGQTKQALHLRRYNVNDFLK
jgi:hypothetical protein